jgi:acetyl-CoA synthetase
VSILEKEGKFFPDPQFIEKAHISSYEQYDKLYKRSIKDPEGFWREIAEELYWYRKPEKILDYNFDIRNGKVFLEWFKGGYTNMCHNCLDRHLDTPTRNRAAIIWQGESDQDTKILTYLTLHREVCRFANVLKKKGLKKGDRVSIYLPMVWQLPVAMLACARLGLIHNIVFAGFSPDSLMHRVQESESTLLITQDEGYRAGKIVPLKKNADEALEQCPDCKDVIVVKRTGNPVPWTEGRDSWWEDEINAEDISDVCPCEEMEAEDTLYLLYTSGSTGKPKGQVHTTGGYMVFVYLTQKWIFDLQPESLYWCMADIGWVTGHSYIVYGPLSNGTTTFIYEGTPLYPKPDRAWELVERYKINILYTAPTAIRALSRQGNDWPNRRDLSSLRLLGSVGEPINPEAWMWYHEYVGRKNCPIVDTWWQTETGGILITPLPGGWPTKPGAATFPFPGIVPRVVDPGDGDPSKRGERMPIDKAGHLCIEKPWPGLSRTVWKDHGLWEQIYFSPYPGMYFTGDGALQDSEGYYFLLGRVDDVINVSGHRISTAEVESALVLHPAVTEAAVAAMPHEIKGQGIYAFVTLKLGVEGTEELQKQLTAHVRKEIGPISTPDKIQFTPALPKTRSGKIMRRILRKIAEDKTEDLGDITTLEDADVIRDLVAHRLS